MQQATGCDPCRKLSATGCRLNEKILSRNNENEFYLWRGEKNKPVVASAPICCAGDALRLQKWKRCSALLPVTRSCLAQVSCSETRPTTTAIGLPKQATLTICSVMTAWEPKSHPAGYGLRSARWNSWRDQWHPIVWLFDLCASSCQRRQSSSLVCARLRRARHHVNLMASN